MEPNVRLLTLGTRVRWCEALYYTYRTSSGFPNHEILWDKFLLHTRKLEKKNLQPCMSSGTPKNSELDFRGQISLHSSVFGVIGKVLKCRCSKWPRMSHLNICSSSYGQKKGRESNCQFDSRPLKVRNRPFPDVYRRSATWRWKALKERYNFGLDLAPIGCCSWEIWAPKVLGLQPGTFSGLLLGSPEKKSHLDVASAESCKEYYMGEGGGFPRVRVVVSQVCPSARGLSQHPRVFPNVN
jgi:hypothetical protein